MNVSEPGVSDVQIRPAHLQDASSIAQVRVSSWRSTYRNILPQEYLSSLSVKKYARIWQGILAAEGRQGYAYVAETDDSQIVGFALGGIERTQDPTFEGELYALYLLEDYQRRGIGRRLLTAVARRLTQAGISSMISWVLAENPARAFYESLGGQQLGKKAVLIAEQTFDQIAYGWLDLDQLASNWPGVIHRPVQQK